MQPLLHKFNTKTLLVRVVTGAVMIALCLWLTTLGGIFFVCALGLLSLAMIFEWTRLVEGRALSLSFYFLSCVSLFAIFNAGEENYENALILLLVATAVFIGISVIRGRALGWLAVVPAYVILPCVAIIWIRTGWRQGLELTFLVFGIVWMTDIGAYFAGKFFGGAKLAPSISPKKTWAGLFGGLILGAMIAIIMSLGKMTDLSLIQAAVIGPLLSLSAIAGDLIESGLKRNFGVKDASGFIPGHGGVLDRVDGMIIAVLVMALWLFVLRYLMGIQAV